MEIARFIVVDDDPVSNLICKIMLEVVLDGTEVKTFTDAREVLNYIREEYTLGNYKKTTLLLDINMPIMSGWEFLEHFNNFDDQVKRSIEINILSSSIDPRDRERSYASKNVQRYLTKPLTPESIGHLITGYSERHLDQRSTD